MPKEDTLVVVVVVVVFGRIRRRDVHVEILLEHAWIGCDSLEIIVVVVTIGSDHVRIQTRLILNGNLVQRIESCRNEVFVRSQEILVRDRMIVAHPDRLILLEMNVRFQHVVPIDRGIESDRRREKIRMELFKALGQFQ